MEFLEQLEERQAESDELQALKRRKQELLERLETLKNEKLDNGLDSQKQSYPKKSSGKEKYADILHAYRLSGVSIQSVDSVLVLQFDPLYRDQYPSTESYNVHLDPKGDNFMLASHNLPPFIPVEQLADTHLVRSKSVNDFVRSVQTYLYAFVLRREAVKHTQKTFKEHIITKPEMDASVTYVRLVFSDGQQDRTMDLTLTYSLQKCVPDSVEIKTFGEEPADVISSKQWEQTVKPYKKKLLSSDLYTAMSEILQDPS